MRSDIRVQIGLHCLCFNVLPYKTVGHFVDLLTDLKNHGHLYVCFCLVHVF